MNRPLEVAQTALYAGISAIPIRANGSKQPALSSWKVYQQRLPTNQELTRWFHSPSLGLAFITGAVSGNLEALDFDDATTFEQWQQQIASNPALFDLYEHIIEGYAETTPAGGRHLLYRCSQIGSNQKLASRPLPDSQVKTLVETRGQGGLIIVYPSQGSVHPSGKPYRLHQGGVEHIKTIEPEQREHLLWSLRQLDETPPTRQSSGKKTSLPLTGDRPGDLFNKWATWEEILAPHGWEFVREVGQESQWRRPGKDGPGISATTNYQGSDLLYVFSSSTPFEPGRGYNKFAAYAILNHSGDFRAAASTLATRKKVSSLVAVY